MFEGVFRRRLGVLGVATPKAVEVDYTERVLERREEWMKVVMRAARTGNQQQRFAFAGTLVPDLVSEKIQKLAFCVQGCLRRLCGTKRGCETRQQNEPS